MQSYPSILPIRFVALHNFVVLPYSSLSLWFFFLLLQCSMLVSLCYSLLFRVLCICLFVVVLWVSYGSFYVAQNDLKCFGSVGNRNSRHSYLNSILIDMKMSFLISHSLFSATFGIVYLFILFESFFLAIWIQNKEKNTHFKLKLKSFEFCVSHLVFYRRFHNLKADLNIQPVLYAGSVASSSSSRSECVQILFFYSSQRCWLFARVYISLVIMASHNKRF